MGKGKDRPGERSIQGEGGAEGGDVVEGFPGEEVDVAGEGVAVGVAEGLGYRARGAAYVAVCGGLEVDGIAELQAAFDGGGAHIENLADFGRDFGVGEGYAGGAVGVDVEAYRAGYADGVGYLYEGFAAYAGGYKVLGDVAGGVGCRAVYFGGVFAREGRRRGRRVRRKCRR